MTPVQPKQSSLIDSMHSWAGAWNRFWFSPTDPTTLGLIRLCCGLLVFYVHLAYTPDLQTLFGPEAWLDSQTMNDFRKEAPVVAPPSGWEGVVPLRPQTAEEQLYVNKWGVNPRQTVATGHHLWSIWFYVTDPIWMRVVHGGVLLILFLFAIGFCTRVTSVLAWLAMLSYIQRAPTTLFGMDTMMIILTLYLVIGPSGAAFSVDRLLARNRARRLAQRLHQAAEVPEAEPSVSANLALRLIQVHFCIIYLAAGLSKLQGSAWWNGTAVWGTMANYEFCPLRFRLYADALRTLAQHRWLWELVTTGETLFTLVFEISFAFLIWKRSLRPLFIIGAVLLHLGIALCMGLVAFSLIMLTGVLAFVPSAVVQSFFPHVTDGAVAELSAGSATAEYDPALATSGS
jgi:hypothetical protein